MKKIGVFLGGVVATVVFVLVVLGILLTQFQPVASTPQPSIQFVIPRGQAVQVIASRLRDAGIIRQPLAFRLELQRLGKTDKLQAGSFQVSANMSLTQLVGTLTTGTNDIWVTIPEGWRREEIADSLATQELAVFNRDEFLTLTDGNEGMLFPDTYLVPRQATAKQLATLLTDTFETKVEEGLSEEIAQSTHSFPEALIMASLVQREASSASEMPMIAGILWKRIEIGMPLQVDATLQYVKGYNKTEKAWWTSPLAADKQLSSPFNTYMNAGLPPRPIANPGLDAIKAALAPVETDNLFYIHDRTGQVHYAKTLEQHNANVQKYLR